MSPVPTPSESPSADPVMPVFLLDEGSLSAQPEFVMVKCSQCKAATPHQWLKVMVLPVDMEVDALELISKAKRLTVCTQCANMSLTK
jgi:hypothetical protein